MLSLFLCYSVSRDPLPHSQPPCFLNILGTHQQRDRPADEPDAADRDPAEEVQGVSGQHPVGDEDAEGEEATVRENLHAQGNGHPAAGAPLGPVEVGGDVLNPRSIQ